MAVATAERVLAPLKNRRPKWNFLRPWDTQGIVSISFVSSDSHWAAIENLRSLWGQHFQNMFFWSILSLMVFHWPVKHSCASSECMHWVFPPSRMFFPQACSLTLLKCHSAVLPSFPGHPFKNSDFWSLSNNTLLPSPFFEFIIIWCKVFFFPIRKEILWGVGSVPYRTSQQMGSSLWFYSLCLSLCLPCHKNSMNVRWMNDWVITIIAFLSKGIIVVTYLC